MSSIFNFLLEPHEAHTVNAFAAAGFINSKTYQSAFEIAVVLFLHCAGVNAVNIISPQLRSLISINNDNFFSVSGLN